MKTLFIIMSVLSTALSAQASDAPTAVGLAVYHQADVVCEPENKGAAGTYVIMNRTRKGTYSAEIRRGSKVEEVVFDQIDTETEFANVATYSSSKSLNPRLLLYETQSRPSKLEKAITNKEYVRYSAVLWLDAVDVGQMDEMFELSCLKKSE